MVRGGGFVRISFIGISEGRFFLKLVKFSLFPPTHPLFFPDGRSSSLLCSLMPARATPHLKHGACRPGYYCIQPWAFQPYTTFRRVYYQGKQLSSQPLTIPPLCLGLFSPSPPFGGALPSRRPTFQPGVTTTHFSAAPQPVCGANDFSAAATTTSAYSRTLRLAQAWRSG